MSSGYVSYPGRGVTVLDFPEVSTPTAEFVYNYRTPSQETYDTYMDDELVEVEYNLSVESEILSDFFEEVAVPWPRYVKLAFEPKVDATVPFSRPNDFGSSINGGFAFQGDIQGFLESSADWPMYRGGLGMDGMSDTEIEAAFTAAGISAPLDEIKHKVETTLRSFARKIQFEESVGDVTQFTGIQLWPTGFNNTIFDLYYCCASIAAIINEQNATNVLSASPGETGSELGGIIDMAEFFNSSYLTGVITNDTKRLLVEALANYQSAGYFDLGAPEAINAFNAFNEMNGSVNVLAARDLAFRAAENYTSIFSAQFSPYLKTFSAMSMLAYGKPAGLAPSETVVWSMLGTFPSENAIQIHRLDDWTDADTGNLEFNEGVVPVGYMIERWEAMEDGTVTSATTNARYYLDGTGPKVFVDPNVKYGKTYFYRVRIVYLAEFAAFNTSPAGESYASLEHSAGVIRTLVASRGVIKEVVTIEQVLPEAPTDIIFNFDRDRGGMFMHWQYPIDMFKQTGKFQVFSRPNINEPFRLLCQIDFTNHYRAIEKPPNQIPDLVIPDYEGVPEDMIKYYETVTTYYVDEEFEVDSKKIYAIAAVDTEGVTSAYSAQFEVTYNTFLRKTEAKYISRSGAPRPYPNVFLRDDVFQDTIKTSTHDSVKVYFDPEYLAAARSKLDMTTATEEIENLKLLRSSPENPDGGERSPTYKLQMINVDLQKAVNLDIVIIDETTDDLLQPGKILPPEPVGT